MEKIDKLFSELKQVESKLGPLQNKRDEIRKNIEETLKEENIKEYEKNNVKSYFAYRKNLIYQKPKEELIEQLKSMSMEDKIETKEELTKDFQEALKQGELSLDGIKVEEKPVLIIKISK